MKLLGKKHGETASGHRNSQIFFFNKTPKAQEKKAEIDRWGHIKLKIRFTQQRKQSTECRDHLQNGRKYM
jgi:hypothetical protein